MAQPSVGVDATTLSQLHTTLSAQQVTRELHAFCRVCPPAAAQTLLVLSPEDLQQLSQQCRVAIDVWLCHDRTFDINRDAPSLTTRDSSLPTRAKARDGMCIVTGERRQCEACHIIPYSIGKSQARSSSDLWSVLAMFWGTEQTNRLKDLVYGPASNEKTFVNKLYNVVTLSRNAHGYWADGSFVLEPHPDDDPQDPLRLHATFRWVNGRESSQIRPGVFSGIGLTDALPGFINNREDILYDIRSDRRVQDGDDVIVETNDPIERPLPSRDLLWLQCTLIQVTRMAGRAGWDMQEVHDSDSHISSVCADQDNGNESVAEEIERRDSSTAHKPQDNQPKAPLAFKAHFKPLLLRRLISRAKQWIHLHTSSSANTLGSTSNTHMQSEPPTSPVCGQ